MVLWTVTTYCNNYRAAKSSSRSWLITSDVHIHQFLSCSYTAQLECNYNLRTMFKILHFCLKFFTFSCPLQFHLHNNVSNGYSISSMWNFMTAILCTSRKGNLRHEKNASWSFLVIFCCINRNQNSRGYTHKSMYVNFTLRKYVIIVQLSRNESGVTDKQENNPPGEGKMFVPLV